MFEANLTPSPEKLQQPKCQSGLGTIDALAGDWTKTLHRGDAYLLNFTWSRQPREFNTSATKEAESEKKRKEGSCVHATLAVEVVSSRKTFLGGWRHVANSLRSLFEWKRTRTFEKGMCCQEKHPAKTQSIDCHCMGRCTPTPFVSGRRLQGHVASDVSQLQRLMP